MEKDIVDVEARDKETILIEIKATVANVQMTALAGAIAVGEKLKEMKELVPHGEWVEYIEENLSWSERKTQRFIQIADKYGDEDSPYSKIYSNPTLMSDLSVTNALKLLAIPEDDIEDFVEEHVEEGMSTKDLEEEIKKYKDAASDLESEVIDLNKKLEEAKAAGDNKEDIEKLQKKLDKANSKIKKLAEEKDAEISAAKKKATEEAYKNAKVQSADEVAQLAADKRDLQDKLAAAERRAENTGNQVLITFKNRTDDFQQAFYEIEKCITMVHQENPDKANNMRKAISELMQRMDDTLQGVMNE